MFFSLRLFELKHKKRAPDLGALIGNGSWFYSDAVNGGCSTSGTLVPSS